jgi:hypothetical protein
MAQAGQREARPIVDRLSPGVLNIEVIVTNELDKSESKRWSVTIPRTPPPAALSEPPSSHPNR